MVAKFDRLTWLRSASEHVGALAHDALWQLCGDREGPILRDQEARSALRGQGSGPQMLTWGHACGDVCGPEAHVFFPEVHLLYHN